MFARIVKVGLLATLALTVAPGSVEGFGKRQSCCYTPIYCPPCPPCPPIPMGWDCVRNNTKDYLRVHITSGFGHDEAIVAPGSCFYFQWRLDNTNDRVLSAFTLDNKLVANFAYPPLNISPPFDCHNNLCLQISGSYSAVQTTNPRAGKK